MPMITGIAMSGVGVSYARFHGFHAKLTLKDGTPAKAVLKRLINGGGKTTAIKLLSAIFEPDLKRLDRGPRKFKDLFGSRVGIVAVEMTVDGAQTALFGDLQPRQVVGFAGRLRKTETGTELERLFFHFMRTPNVGIESLPIGPEDERPARNLGIRSLLNELYAANPGMELQMFEQQGDWQAHVERTLRIDLASSIHFMMALNMQESGATTDILKRFQRNEDFLDFLLDPIIGTANDEGLVGTVSQTLRSQSTLTEKRARREFFHGSAARLETLAMEAARKRAAVAAHGEAVGEYRKVLGLILGRKDQLERDVSRDSARLEELTEALNGTRSEMLRLTRERNWIDLHALRLKEALSEEEAKAAGTAATEASRRLARTRAMIAAAEIGDLDARIASLDAQIAERDAPLTEARGRLRHVGGKALALLREIACGLETSLADAQDTEEGLRRTGEELAARGARANAALEDARRRARDAAAELGLHRREFDGLVHDGHLRADEDLAQALGEAARQLAAETAAKTALEERQTDLRMELDRATGAGSDADRQLSEALQEVARMEGELSAFGEALAATRSLPSLQVRFGDGVDIYGPGILPDLQNQRDQVIQRSHDLGAENDRFARTIASIDEHGLLPPPDEIERTLQALKKAGLNAHWTPRYLVRNRWPAERIRTALEADPARFSGIVVLGVDAAGYREIAADLSASHAFRIPVCIVSASGEPVVAAAAGDRVVVLPAASTYDVGAAREERDNLDARIARNALAISDLDAESEQLSRDSDTLKGFRTRYPEGYEVRMRAGLDAALVEVEAREAGLALARETRAAIEQDLAGIAGKIRVQAEVVGRAAIRDKALADFDARWRDRAPKVLEAAEEAAEAILEAENEIAAVAEEKPRHAQATAVARQTRETFVRQLSATEHRVSAIKEFDRAARPSPGERIDDLETEYQALESLVRQLDYGSDLSQSRAMLNADRSRKHTAYGTAHRDHPLDDVIRELAATSRPTEADLPGLEAASDRLREELGAATSRHKEARRNTSQQEKAFQGELAEPGDVAELNSIERCELASSGRSDRLGALERNASALGEQTEALSAGIAGARAEIGLCDTARREATSIKGVSGLDAIVPDKAGAAIQAKDLAEREFEGRTSINAADLAVDDADNKLRAQIGKYQRYLDLHAKQRACEDIVAKLREWTDRAMEANGAELYSQHLDLVKSFDDKIAEAQREMDKCAEVIRGYFERVLERVLIVERLSTMPDGLGEWSGKPFLKIRLPDDKAGRAGLMEHVGARIGEWLEQAVSIHSQPEGKASIPAEHATLLKQIAVFVLRDKLRFDALRIRTNWKVEYKPVTDLKLYSGGEKLMATLLLFFLSVRIGMETRQGTDGRASRDASMFIMLDNPIGEMNALQLVRPALEMAEKSNIQLIGWTGINDMNVLGLFPMVVSLRRRVGVTNTYVEVEGVREGAGPDDGAADRIDTAHLGKVPA
jgi:hypothetical protein